MNFLQTIGLNRKQAIKEKILKNKDLVLDALSERMKGARQCPFLMANKCIGGGCEHFMAFWQETPQGKVEFHRCSHVQTPLLLIEMNNLLRQLLGELKKE